MQWITSPEGRRLCIEREREREREESVLESMCVLEVTYILHPALANQPATTRLGRSKASKALCYEERRGEERERRTRGTNQRRRRRRIRWTYLPSFVFVCSPVRDLGDHGGLCVPYNIALFYLPGP